MIAPPALSPAAQGAFAVLGGSWMALGPQVPLLRVRRGALAALTWCVARFALAALAATHGALPGRLAVGLALDFATWRVLAASDGAGPETEWGWVASPAVWLLAPGAPWPALAVALALALGVALGRRRSTRRAWSVLGLVPVVAAIFGAIGPVWPRFTCEGPTLARVASAFHVGTGIAPPVVFLLALLAVVTIALVRGRGAADVAVAGFGAFAALAPRFAVGQAVLWAPVLSHWAADDPDRRGWWLVYGTALPVAFALSRGALAGDAGASWRGIAVLGVAGAVALGAWPIAAALRRDAPAPAR